MKKHAKVDIQLCFPLFQFTEFFSFVSNILATIAWANKVLVLTGPSLLQTLVYWYFVCYQSISPILKENIKHVSEIEIRDLTVLSKQYFEDSV